MADSRAGRIEGYAIISEDGMLATAARIMPDSLKFDADQQFFGHGLDGVDVVVHGRHSQERQPHSHLRHRLMLTRSIPALAAHPSNEKALLWNPVFGLFLDRYDIFHLTRVPNVRLPGGRPVFPGVPARTPEDVLASHGLVPDAQQILDPAQGLTMVSWRRAAKPAAD